MKKIFILTSIFCLLTSQVFAATPTPKATDSADIDPETIKENIKKRIEQVIKNQNNTDALAKKRVAYVGTLNSITTTSLAIETTDGLKQASTSALTTFVELTKNKEVKFDDVALGDYIAALGYVNPATKVLDARRILVLKNPPAKPTKSSLFGAIQKADVKKSTLTLVNLKTGETTLVYVSSKTILQGITKTATRKTTLNFKDLPLTASVLVVYDRAENQFDTNRVSSVLVRTDTTNPIPTVTPSPSPSPKPKKP